jgi:RNA polymerase sigma-70 factor (ECF subfamily)
MDLENSRRGKEAAKDEDLVRSFQAGDRRAFDELTIRHQDRIVNLCRWFLGDFQEACDVAQDVFVKALKGLDNFRFQASFSTWLYKIAVNTCKNRINSLEYRFRRFKVRISGESDGDALPFEIPDDRSNPANDLEDKERRMLIAKAIDNLAPRYRTVVVLRDLEGLSYERIAEVAGLKIGTVKSRLARGREILFDSLRKVFGDEMLRD